MLFVFLSLGELSVISCSAVAIVLTLQDLKVAIFTTTHCDHLLAPPALLRRHFIVTPRLLENVRKPSR